MAERTDTRRSSIQRRTRPRRLPASSVPTDTTTSHSFTIPTAHLPDTQMETFVETSKGYKRVVVEPVSVSPSSPVKRMRMMERTDSSQSLHLPAADSSASTEDQQAYSISLWDQEEATSDVFDASLADPSRPKKKKKASKVSDPRMTEWAEVHRDRFLEALLWLDGRGWYTQPSCSRCGNPTRKAVYRCCDCSHGPLVCAECIVADHSRNPLHWIEEWTGSYFKRRSLNTLGLRVQLGHIAGERCLLARSGHHDFTIIHHNGIHQISVDFCGCALNDSDPAVQLLRSSFYPATGDRPQTCATLSCLDEFHALSLHGKTTAYDYYHALEYRTSGCGMKPLDRYRAFLRMARQYRHLLLLKRRGCGHTSIAIRDTKPGSLAIPCPACPRPGVNLPANWMDARRLLTSKLSLPIFSLFLMARCLYIMFIAMDACFRLKRRLIGSDIRDPGLGTGWAYLVEWEPYRQFLLTVTDQKEISTCTGLAALDHANTKFARGYSATGVGAGICARHEFVLANGVGDLQRGERYANMDYILASLLRHIAPLLRKIFSYDIACQWAKDLKNCLLALPPLVRIRLAMDLCRFAVPKMHINAHILLCRLLFSLALIPGSGGTDGEGIERLWAAIAGFWNWSKLLGLAKLLRRRLENAKAELEKQEDSFRVFSAQQAEHVPEWVQMVKDFEADGSKPNPYAMSEPEGLTEAEVRQALEAEDREEAEKGRVALHAVAPSEFMVLGLEIEDEQRRLRVQAHLKRTDTTIRLKPMRKKLAKGLKRLRELQATYTPTSLVCLATLRIADDVPAEDIPLLLPSALSASERDGCTSGLLEIES
ncbi:CxC2 domain-containing protein [Mycena kentingensis (nom. inval.)]|nr:CxC2 domain-containing protein [Mycena kentingensis (nom. inval.)]